MRETIRVLLIDNIKKQLSRDGFIPGFFVGILIIVGIIIYLFITEFFYLSSIMTEVLEKKAYYKDAYYKQQEQQPSPINKIINNINKVMFFNEGAKICNLNIEDAVDFNDVKICNDISNLNGE